MQGSLSRIRAVEGKICLDAYFRVLSPRSRTKTAATRQKLEVVKFR